MASALKKTANMLSQESDLLNVHADLKVNPPPAHRRSLLGRPPKGKCVAAGRASIRPLILPAAQRCSVPRPWNPATDRAAAPLLPPAGLLSAAALP